MLLSVRRIQSSLFGATIVRVENGKIVEWSDYYDQSSSRRMSLGAFFTDWIECCQIGARAIDDEVR